MKNPSPAEVEKVFEALTQMYGSAKTELTYNDPFQLLVAVILSAQCTDARVNMTTPELFRKFPTADKLGKANQKEIETLVHSCGFFRMKAKAIISTSKDLVDKFNGRVPGTLEELVSLSGVGRKTASVVLNQAFDVPAIAVDTHVKRVSHRLGWTQHTDPHKIELDLKEVVPMKLWAQVNGLLILHGRRTCKSIKPRCEECFISMHCEFFKRGGQKTKKAPALNRKSKSNKK